jgi:hypothetical protein
MPTSGSIDTVKAVFTYITALVLVVGGFAFLFLTRNDPSSSNTPALIPIVSGFIGSAVTFVFQQETQTRTARQVERSYTNAAATQPVTTVTAGPPAQATVSPAPAVEAAVTPDVTADATTDDQPVDTGDGDN